MKTRTKELLSISFLSAWLIVALTAFVIANRISYIQPFFFPGWQVFGEQLNRIVLLNYLFDLFLSLVGVSIFSIVCIGLGLNILNRLKIHPISDLAFGVTAFLIGEIIFSLIFLTVISTFSLTPLITTILTIIGFIIGFTPLWKYGQGLRRYHQLGEFGKQQKEIIGLTIGILILSLLLSTARLGYDAVSDYFSQAKLMAVSYESSSFFPGNYMIVSSLHPDILFTALIQLFGDQSARMLSWVNGLAILLMGLAIAEETGLSLRTRLYFLVLMLTSTAFVDLLGDGKIELISTAPIFAAVYWILHSIRTPAKGILLLIGFLTGFAIISRLYNIFLVSVFVASFYIIWLIKKIYIEQRNDILSSIKAGILLARPIFWMFPTLLMMGVFHLWQNWLWLGSPFAPLDFAQKLEAGNWEWQFDPTTLNTLRFLYPLTVTFFNTPQSLGNITPLFVGFLPFLLIKDVRTRFRLTANLNYLLLVAIFTLTSWVMFFYTIVEIRYAMFLWTLLFLPAAQLIEHTLEFAPKLIAILLRVLLMVLLVYIALRTVMIALSTYSPIDNNGQAYCYDIDFCTFFESVNQTAALGDRVLALNAHRYYLRPDLFACSSRSNEYPALQELARKNVPDFWVEVYRQGYRFLTYEKNFSEFHSRFGTIPDPQTAPSWLKISVISTSDNKDNIAYRIEAENPPFQPEITCQRDNAENVWQLLKSQ